jgi:TRAP-type C4-dicarboxylate transport system permease small subunit
VAFFERIIRPFIRICDYIAQAAVVVMMLLVVGNILLRIVWKPILGTYDLAGFIGAIIVAFAIAYCSLQKGHIQVEFLMERFSGRVQGIIGSVTGILSLGIFSLATWQCIVLANDMRRTGEVSMSAHISFYPYIYGVAFGCALLCLVILIDLIKSVVKAVRG